MSGRGCAGAWFLRLAGCISLILLSGCASAGRYAASRGLDLWDVVPLSVKYGSGLSASVHATPFLEPALGAHDARAYGMAIGRWGPVWDEQPTHLLLWSEETARYPGWSERGGAARSETDWPVAADWRGYHDAPVSSWRFPDHKFLFLPVPSPASEEGLRLPPAHAWGNVEADLFLFFIGARVALCPGELVDFLLGWFGVDVMGDDVSGPDAMQGEHEPDA